ncbi:hypothetical protein [Pseudomonas sp. B33.4]|uniref:hypothetical protein n=1 Tax=Pseudomonas sp. B33.4 TaxID=3104265 RepID=UPI002ADEFB21|nr:hypothetical protein [Pseudomonas sp. B33.4]
MKLYENVAIGNFLYGLGFAIRSGLEGKTTPFPSVVNLLQQTPADTALGDVLLTFPGVVRLIEFKAQGARMQKEQLRHRALMAALEKNDEMRATSKQIHWYVDVAASSEVDNPLLVRAVPYVEALGTDARVAQGMENFIRQTAKQALVPTPETSTERAQRYLALVRMTQGKEDTGTSGLLLVLGGGGALHFAQLRDITDLDLPHREWLVDYEKRSMGLAARLERAMPDVAEKEMEYQAPEMDWEP